MAKRAGSKRSADGAELASAGDRHETFIGVTAHQKSGRYEAHLWHCGRQLYLGSWAEPSVAAVAFDIGALAHRGDKGEVQTNYHPDYYAPFLEQLKGTSPEEVVIGLRKHSKGATAQTSIYRGVSRHAKGRWEARVGGVGGARRYKYLGLFSTEFAAAKAYDLALLEQKGVEALTNFHLSVYLPNLSASQVLEALEKGILSPTDLEAPCPQEPLPEGTVPVQLLAQREKGGVAAVQLAPAQPSNSSSEDGLAPPLFGCILGEEAASPQTVLPPQYFVAHGEWKAVRAAPHWPSESVDPRLRPGSGTTDWIAGRCSLLQRTGTKSDI